jgi:hypothetical protein
MIVRELNGLDEMLKHLNVLNELYPHLTEEEYKADLQEVLDYNDLTLASKLTQGQVIIIPDAEVQTSVAKCLHILSLAP